MFGLTLKQHSIYELDEKLRCFDINTTLCASKVNKYIIEKSKNV